MNLIHHPIRTVKLRKDGAFLFPHRKIAAQFGVSRATLARRHQGFPVGITPGRNVFFQNNSEKEVTEALHHRMHQRIRSDVALQASSGAAAAPSAPSQSPQLPQRI